MLSDLPTSDDGVSSWLFARWAEKDQLLEGFYSKPTGQRQFEQTPTERAAHAKATNEKKMNLMFRQFSLILLFGLIFLWQSTFLYRHSLVALIFHLLMSGIWIVIRRRENGIDTLILEVEQAANQQKANRAGENSASTAAALLIDNTNTAKTEATKKKE